MVSLRFFIVNIFVHLDLESPSLYRLFTKGLPARFSRVFWNMNINIVSKLPNSFVRLFLKIWLWWSDVFIIEGSDKMCDIVTMIRGVYYERLWQCQGCSDKGRSYLLKQPAGPEAMMRSKKRNIRTSDYHCDKDSFGTWQWREIQGQGSFSSKVIAISLGKLHLDTSTLKWIRSVCLFTLDKIVVSSVQYAIFMQYNWLTIA